MYDERISYSLSLSKRACPDMQRRSYFSMSFNDRVCPFFFQSVQISLLEGTEKGDEDEEINGKLDGREGGQVKLEQMDGGRIDIYMRTRMDGVHITM